MISPDLIKRVEEATGSDRELDGLIEVAARWEMAAAVGLKPEHRAKWQSGPLGQVYDGNTGYSAGNYTASLDAAVALAERLLPDDFWHVGTCSNHPASRYSADLSCGGGEQSHRTPALAMILALLNALPKPEPKGERTCPA